MGIAKKCQGGESFSESWRAMGERGLGDVRVLVADRCRAEWGWRLPIRGMSTSIHSICKTSLITASPT